MGNRSVNAVKRKRKRLSELREHMRNIRVPKQQTKPTTGPKSLVALCKNAIKKHKLIPEKKKFTAPENFSVVGGKPLRKRPVKPSPGQKIKKENKRTIPRLAVLCQIVVKEYNLLPQCEETEQPSSTQLLLKTNTPPRKRGRPLKSEQQKKIKLTKPRRKPPKKAYDEVSISYSTFIEQSQHLQGTGRIKLEAEDTLDDDPLRRNEDDLDYTVIIKEENIDVEPEEFTQRATIELPRATPQGIVVNPMAQLEIPGTSRSVVPKMITVVADEYQLFANSIAEQLRVLPPNRALLLQLDIQSMIDNEKQLMKHES